MNAVAIESDRPLLDAFSRWLPAFDASKQRSFSLYAADPKAAKKEATRIPSSDGDDYLTKLADQVRARYDRDSAAIATTSSLAQIVTICGGLAAIALGIVIALLIGSAISRRLRRVSAALGLIVRDDVGALVASMQRLAAGDLSVELQTSSQQLAVEGSDESAQLTAAYNDLVEGVRRTAAEFTTTTQMLATLVSGIRDSVEEVTTAAGSIAEGSASLSQRTEEQASGLEETASSMEEFTATVKQNSDSAQEADTLSSSAQTQARQSGAAVGDVVTTMNAIEASSQRIVEIISVIDTIAFQTNILALNAAVEAARAGEQGRGFAVVAGEVRSLAQRSSEAAKEIKALIGDTVAKVAEGSRQVETAGTSMNGLVEIVRRVAALVSDIAAASREQSVGIDQVNRAIAQMDEVTQQNSALVEEAAAAAGSLDEQARTLIASVSAFTVGRPAPVHGPLPKVTPHIHTSTRAVKTARATT
jgi:methyl-accepting chemotaxis protein